jgi:hypothetical protein
MVRVAVAGSSGGWFGGGGGGDGSCRLSFVSCRQAGKTSRKDRQKQAVTFPARS